MTFVIASAAKQSSHRMFRHWIATSLMLLAMTLVNTACVPQSQPYAPEKAATLPVQEWLPKSKPRAVILALHGFNDYSHAFEGAGRYFASRRIATYAYDQRGFGGNEEAGIWGGDDNLTQDVVYQLERIRTKHPHTPIFILGESMGGAVALATLTQPNAPEVDGLILVAPAVWGQESMPLFYRLSLWCTAHTIPWWELTGSDLKIRATDNDEILREMWYDPLVIKKTRIDAVYGLMGIMDTAYTHVQALNTPTLLLYGAKDQVIPAAPVHHVREQGAKNITYLYYPDGYHMLLRDLQAKKVMGDIASWVDKRRGRRAN